MVPGFDGDFPSALNVVSADHGPQAIQAGDRLWLDPDDADGVQAWATPRGYVAATERPPLGTERLGRVTVITRRIRA